MATKKSGKKSSKKTGRRETRHRRRLAGGRGCRDEKVIIVFHGDEWRVVPGIKVLSQGQDVTFQSIGADTLELNLPPVFKDQNLVGNGHGNAKVAKLSTRVLADAEIGLYEYEALCDGAAAHGNSGPGIIIDP